MTDRFATWSDGMAAAFVAWRKGNRHAYSMLIGQALQAEEIIVEFEQWYAVQRLLGKPLPNPTGAPNDPSKNNAR